MSKFLNSLKSSFVVILGSPTLTNILLSGMSNSANTSSTNGFNSFCSSAIEAEKMPF